MATHEDDAARLLRSRDGSKEFTSFAPFEADKTVSTALAYKGEVSKPPQVEINDYLGPPKVLYRKLRASTSGQRGQEKSPRASPQPQSLTSSDNPRSGGGGGSRRVRTVDREEGGGGSASRRVRVGGERDREDVAGGGSRRVRVGGERDREDVAGGGSRRVRVGGERDREDVAGGGSRRVRVGGERDREDVAGGGSRRVVDSGRVPSIRVSKSLVLNRIGTLEKDQDTRQDLKRYWMPDSACKECSECGTKFNIIVRRHHCRICGRIFCNSCCSLTIPGMKLHPHYQGNLRVCKECLEIFQEFQAFKRSGGPSLNPADPHQCSEPAPASLRSASNSLQKNPGEQAPAVAADGATLLRAGSGSFGRNVHPMSMLSPHKSWDDASSGRSQDDLLASPSVPRLNGGFDNPTPLRSMSGRREIFESLHEREERLMALNEDEVEYVITEVWFQLINPATGLVPQNHRYRLRTFPNTFSASEIITWLMRKGHARTRDVAVTMGQALVDTKRLQVVSSLDTQFKDEANLFLEFGQAANLSAEHMESPTDLDAPKWFQRLPENGDSEVERSQSLGPDHERLQVRYSVIPRSYRGSFLASTQPTITISSMSELTGVVESTVVPEMALKPQDDYLIIDHDHCQASSGENELKLSLHVDDHSMSPAITSPPSSLPIPFGPNSPLHHHQHNASYTIVNDREIMKTLPVAGLSSAADAAQDFESENRKDVKTNEEARAVFEQEHNSHFDAVMIQLIKSYGMSLGWLKVIKPLIMEAARKVKTNVYSTDVMDIKHYVKVKKIPGGRRVDSMLISGVVCTKNITHKKMQISIRNPTILLLKCAFEFQRKENQLSSFDTLQMQEEKYLKNLVARVKTFQPRVILVQKSVARLALEMFYHLDIVVAVNVKPSVMERVARSTQGDLLHSLDQLFFNVQLGCCGQFYLRNFVLPDGVKKSLMYFDHCDSRLGCAITLMGGSKRELKKVKKATLFGVYVAYNSQLESSFLIDEFAWPVSPDLQLLPDTEGYSSSPTTPEWPLYPSVTYPVGGIAPAELARRLEALAPELKAARESNEASSQSTPTTVRSSIGSRNSNKSPLMSNTRQYSLGRFGSDQNIPNLVVTQDEVDGKHTPTTLQSLEDGRYRSDPHSLHYQGMFTGDAASLSRLGEMEFKKALGLQILSISPSIRFPIPYLQSPAGFEADIRKYLPSVIYWSYQFLVQVRPVLPKSTGRKSQSASSSPALSTRTSTLEMGIRRSTLGSTEWNWSAVRPSSELEHGNQCTRSYRSIAEHPFTTSIFLLKANTNEMKAALADYRANSGLANPSSMFFFPTASRASDYRMQLQNIFNKYQQFELTDTSEDHSTSEDSDDNDEDDKNLEETDEGRVPPERHLRQRARRHKTPSFCSSGEGAAERRRMLARSSEVRDGAVEAEDSDTTGRERRKLSIPEGAAKSRGSRDATPLVTMGTLDDIDKDYSKLAAQPLEDEALDLHGNEEWSAPPVISEHLTSLFPPFQQVDCMDPIHHQSISILFSSTCHDGQRHQLPCVPPCVIQMLYYGRNDISLGDFLKRYCFRPDYRCQTCGSEMTKHHRHIIHGSSALHISMQQLDTSIPRSNDGIFTWLACKHCTLCTPYNKMSDNSLLVSFAKFLELKFHCDQFVTRFHSSSETTCQHSLHSDYLHYFCYRNKIACFQPAVISILEVTVPPTVVVINTPHSEYHHNFAKEIKHIEHITEGVCYRIKQRLQAYNMEPVSSQVVEFIGSSKAERDAFRTRIKLLKDKVVHGGFLDSGKQEMSEDEGEAEFAALQDGIAEIKRALTEFISCWNIELETLDNKMKMFQSRRDVGTTRSTDRDSPFTPMAAEIPSSRGATPRTLVPPQQTDASLVHTPLSSPPDTSLEETRAGASSLNTEAIELLLSVDQYTPDSQTEVGVEVKISDDTRSSQESRDAEKSTVSSHSEKIVSSGEISQLDSRISSQSLSGEVVGAERVPRMETVQENAARPNETATGTTMGPKETTMEPTTRPIIRSKKPIENEEGGGDRDGETEEDPCFLPPSFRRRSAAFSDTRKLAALSRLSGSAELVKQVTDLDRPVSSPVSAADMPVSFDGDQLANMPTVVVRSDGMGGTDGEEGEGEGEGWSSPMSNLSDGGMSPGKPATPTDNEEKGGDYQSVKTLNYIAPTTGLVSGAQKFHQPPSDETQSDGVGIFAKFRGTKDKDMEVKEDPTRFYLVDAAEMAKSSPVLGYKTPEASQHHHHHHGQRPHRRPGTIPRKNGPSSIASSAEADGRTSRGQREKERSLLTRPFQKLPPPFELNEHHNMHKSLKIPIAIYEKEPTSLIAYALSSREYAQEYWAMVERRPNSTQPEKQSRPSSPKAYIPKKQNDPPLFQVPPPTKTSALKQAYQELKKKGPLNAMNVFSGLTVSSTDRSDAYDKSGDEPRRIEAALSSKSSHTSSSSLPATDQPAAGEDGDGFRWNTTGDHASTGSSSKAGHIYLEFTAPDRSSSIFCKVYFAEEFQHLREMVFPSGEDKFIRSLSRCVKFDAKGGKSRSTFCKVIDDRFIMKQIKSVEISSFEQIAPLYFEHVISALESKRPLVLAKILGVYSIGYRNTRTGNSKRLDVIVMENLLYGRKSSKVFDLKGSMRSRYIDPSKDSSSDVLLDENFLNHICYAPVYVYPHSKTVLMRAIQEDTEFLAHNAIMDYSLLTCIDDQTGELVVGIIDYVRTFTLDKRLEMYIKKTAGRVLPTVVYPELYRKRFCEAMDRYFTVVPDKWTGLGADIKL